MCLKNGIIIFMLLFISAASRAQKLNYSGKKISLIRLFKEIKTQTGFSVVWNEKEFNVNQLTDVNFRNTDLKKVMDDVSGQLTFTYTILGKTIIISRKNTIASSGQVTEPNAETKPVDTSGKWEFYLPQVEIMSTGYQHIPKERVTGSFALVDSTQLHRKISFDIFSRLEGIANGLLFNKNTPNSKPGSLDLSIRGRSTIFANDQPLIILDNFPLNGDLNSINPNDVASVTILKDAAAASIWGVRAGNGVIVISTKKGKFNQALNVSLNANITVSGKPDVFYNPNYLSSTDFIDIETFLFKNGKYDAALVDRVNYPVVSPVVQILDRQRKGQSANVTEQQLNVLRKNDIRNEELKYFYRNPVSQQYALALSGGSAKTNHYFSVGYDRLLSSFVNNDTKKTTINSQNTVKLLSNLELSTGLYYVKSVSRVDSTIMGTSGTSFIPYFQFKDANGKPAVFDRDYNAGFKTSAHSRGFLDWSYVPLDELGESPIIVNGNDLRLNGGLKYTPIPGLSAEIKYQYQRMTNNIELFSSMKTYFTRSLINRYAELTNDKVSGYPIPLGSILYETKARGVANNFRAQLNYQKYWKNHELSAIAGYELSEHDTDVYKNSYYGYDPKSGTSVEIDSGSTFNLNPSGMDKIGTGRDFFGKLDRIRSVFTNTVYTYHNKYSLSASARIDGSNYFGVKTNQKSVPLWSVGGLWNIDRENFYKLNWLPILRIRATYGYNGNLDRGNTGITILKYSNLRALYTNLPFASIINIGNPELRWEKIAITNFGLDFGLKALAITGRVEYYFKKGTDILGDKAFPASTGIKILRGNYAEMEAQGMEISLTSQNLSGRLNWKTNLLFSMVHDRVTAYGVIEPNNAYYVGIYNKTPVLGKPVYGIYSYKWAGLDPLNGDPRGYLNGVISKDYNALNAALVTDLEYNGPARPTVFGGLNNTVSYRKFTLVFNISYKLGYYFRKPSVDYYNMYNHGLNIYMNRDFTSRWKKSGDEAITNVPSMMNYTDNESRDLFYNRSSATVAKGDHIRLQDISLSFDLNRDNWKSIPVKQLQIYAYANNLGIIWKANNFDLDPDLIPGNGERFYNPIARSLSVGFKISF